MWDRTKSFLSKFTGRFINLDFTSAWENFDEKKYFWKIFLPSSRMERKLVCFLSKLFRRGCGNHNVFSEQKLFWNLQRFFHNFETLIDFFPAYLHFISAGLSKLHFRCPWKIFDEKKTWKIWIFSLLWVFERKFFAFFPNSFCLICQNCIIRVHRKLEWKLFLHKMSIFCYIGTLSEYFCPLVGNLPAVFSKLPSLCLKQRFEKKLFFSERNFVVFIIPGYWAKTFWQFDFFCQGCQNSILVARKKNLRRFFSGKYKFSDNFWKLSET